MNENSAMLKKQIDDRDFTGIDFTAKLPEQGNYENCTFKNCVFTEVDLGDSGFFECRFENCDLSMINVVGTAFRDVAFRQCKMLGIHFEQASELWFSMSFEECQLNLTSFFKRSLKATRFENCSLRETDLGEADFTKTVFKNCDFTDAIFDRTRLEKADLSTSFNFNIDPETNFVSGAKFSAEGALTLLRKFALEIV